MAKGLVFGGLNSGGKAIKRIQSGEVTLTHGTSTLNVTLEELDLSNSVLYVMSTCDFNNTQDAVAVRGDLSTSTNLRLYRASASGAITVVYYIIEYTKLKSCQRGLVSLTSASSVPYNIAITTVDATKSTVVLSVATNDNTYSSCLATGKLTANNQLTIKRYNGYTVYISWQVVEFE